MTPNKALQLTTLRVALASSHQRSDFLSSFGFHRWYRVRNLTQQTRPYLACSVP